MNYHPIIDRLKRIAELLPTAIGGDFVPSGTKQISITQNGTTTENVYSYANAEISVNVPTGIVPSGTKQISITQNGTTTEDVTQYASAEITVNVPSIIYTMSPSATANIFPAAAQAIRNGAYSIIGNNKPFIAVWYSGDQISNYISVMMDIPPGYGGGTGKGQTLVARNGDRRFARMLDYDQISASYDYFCSASSVYQVIDLSNLYAGIIT